MRNTIMIIAACLLFMNTGAPAEDVTPGGIDEVSLAYSSGWVGRIHEIWLKSDGTAIFRGDHNVNKIGTFQSKFPKGEFLKLVAYLVETDFESFEKEYNRRGTDGSAALITIRRNKSKPKEVLLHNPEDPSAHPKIWAIKRLIEAIVSDLKWEDYGKTDESYDLNAIILPEFQIPACTPPSPHSKASLQHFVEKLWEYSIEFDPHVGIGKGVNIILDIPDADLERESIKIDMKNVSVQQLLHQVASLQGLDLSVKGRTVTIRKRKGSL